MRGEQKEQFVPGLTFNDSIILLQKKHKVLLKKRIWSIRFRHECSDEGRYTVHAEPKKKEIKHGRSRWVFALLS